MIIGQKKPNAGEKFNTDYKYGISKRLLKAYKIGQSRHLNRVPMEIR